MSINFSYYTCDKYFFIKQDSSFVLEDILDKISANLITHSESLLGGTAQAKILMI